MKTIELTKGYVAIIDDGDYEMLAAHKWSAHENKHKDGAIRTVYARRGCVEKKRYKNVFMHREVLGAGRDQTVDHINSNGLDNTRKNLRLCTSSQNSQNSRLRKTNTSGFKGVSRQTQGQKWQARIEVNGINIHLGTFEFSKQAARAYDKAAKEHHGEFARLNGV